MEPVKSIAVTLLLLFFLPSPAVGASAESLPEPLPEPLASGEIMAWQDELFVYIRAGLAQGNYYAIDELYRVDPPTGASEVVPISLPENARINAGVAVDERLMLAYGGVTDCSECFAMFDPSSGTTTYLGAWSGETAQAFRYISTRFMAWVPDAEPLRGCPAGCLYAYDGQGAILRFSPEIGYAVPEADVGGIIPDGAGMILDGDRLLFFGGVTVDGRSDEVFSYSLSDGEIEVIATLPRAAIYTALTVMEDEVVLIGNSNGGREVVHFDLNTYEVQVHSVLPYDVTLGKAASIGEYVYTIRPTDTDKLHNILRYDPSNSSPTVTVAGATTGRTGDALAFAASASDGDGSVESYGWTFGDGATATGEQVTHAYSQAGTYTVEVTVTDDEGATASDSVQVTVTDPPPPPPPPPEPNEAPSASFSATGGVLSASFDASGSSDADGDSLSYSWDFGDGSTGSGRAPSHDYDAAGSYTVELTVSDGEGSDSATQSVTVSAPTAPVAAFTLSASSVVESGKVTADASTTTEGSGSHSYAWFLDGVSKGAGVTKTFSPGIGSHTIELVVTNGYDQESTTTKSLTVTAKPEPEPEQDEDEPDPDPAPEPTNEADDTDKATTDKQSPLGFLVIPALLAAALLLRRR